MAGGRKGSGTPKLKVFNPEGEYVASCKYAEDAAAICAGYGDGAQIRYGHTKADTLFTNGTDGDAGESYSEVAELCYRLIEARRAAAAASYRDWLSRQAETK